MKISDREMQEEQRSTKTVKERLSKYLANWYFFVVITGLCVGAAFLYARYTVPKYMATTAFLVKKNESGSNSNDLIEEALNGKKAVNLNNEMLVVGSSTLMERVVRKEKFNICYYKIGKILNIDVYVDAPFRLQVKEIKDSSAPVSLTLQTLNLGGGTGHIGIGEKGTPFSFQWNVPFATGGKTLVLVPSGKVANGDGNYLVTWRPVNEVAARVSGALSITPFDIKTSAVELSLKVENLQRGKDILNTLFREFNLSDIEDRNKLSESTVQFIDDRLLAISGELDSVEGNLEGYQGRNRLADVKGQSAQSLENSGSTAKTIKDLAVQQRVVDLTLDYFANPVNSNKLIPSTLGLDDGTIATLISQYNALQQKREREAPEVAPNSTVMQDLNTQIGSLKAGILESLANINKNLRLQENNYRQQKNQSEGFLSALPHNERVLQEIRRKQSITEGLYLYLLQKREESAISSTAASITHYKQIDLAKGYGPVEPNIRNWIIMAALLGLSLSFALIYLKDLMNDTVSNREDITRKLRLQIFGEIGHVSGRKKSGIAVLTNDMIGEQFRAIRTNLSFVLKNKAAKTILITSSSQNEGKSFVGINLATVCAAPGKRVALLEFDIRKPELKKSLGFNTDRGITSYLMGETDDLSAISHVLGEIPTLHIYPAGPALMNSSDLLLAENVSRLFEALKYQYDFIIVDSPPVGLVSDAFVLGEFSDLVLYIVRQRTTLRKQLDLIHEIEKGEQFGDMGLILNDMKTGSKYGYENYGYGKYEYQKKNAKAGR